MLPTDDLLRAHIELITCDLTRRLIHLDWADPDAVAQAERAMKVLTAAGRNIEKCIDMVQVQDGPAVETEAEERERLRSHLHRELVRYADRLGREELARRLAADYAEAGGERVAFLGPEGSVPPE